MTRVKLILGSVLVLLLLGNLASVGAWAIYEAQLHTGWVLGPPVEPRLAGARSATADLKISSSSCRRSCRPAAPEAGLHSTFRLGMRADAPRRASPASRRLRSGVLLIPLHEVRRVQ